MRQDRARVDMPMGLVQHGAPRLNNVVERYRALARRKPAVERGQDRPRLFKLEADIDRQLVAGCTQWHMSRIGVIANFRLR